MTTNHDLAKQIEDLVRQHVDALRNTAAAAVMRAFAGAPPHEWSRTSMQARPVRMRRTAAPRRAPDELVALGERFYAVLCQQPGETMATLAPQVGIAPQVLHVAVARLRRAGQVRTIGNRQHTRYYPMTTSSSATTATTSVAA